MKPKPIPLTDGDKGIITQSLVMFAHHISTVEFTRTYIQITFHTGDWAERYVGKRSEGGRFSFTVNSIDKVIITRK